MNTPASIATVLEKLDVDFEKDDLSTHPVNSWGNVPCTKLVVKSRPWRPITEPLVSGLERHVPGVVSVVPDYSTNTLEIVYER